MRPVASGVREKVSTAILPFCKSESWGLRLDGSCGSVDFLGACRASLRPRCSRLHLPSDQCHQDHQQLHQFHLGTVNFCAEAIPSIKAISFRLLIQQLEMGSNGVGTLPADLFHLLSAELSNRLDFDTLYSCVASSKQIANSGAISALYR